jgi:hypothetical protein
MCMLNRLASLLALAGVAYPQILDFETLPDGSPTTDMQVISTEYAGFPFGVTFEVVDPVTGQFLGYPRIAKVGPPRTAFQGCGGGSDNTVPNAGVCKSFLTDDDQVGSIGSLRVLYGSPVAGASGSLLDVDMPSGVEQWTVTASDSAGNMVDVVVVDPLPSAPCGGSNGDGTAVTWSVSAPGGARVIQSLLFEYTGTHPLSLVGVAFDNFTPSESGLGAPVPGCDPVANSTLGPALTFASGSEFVAQNQFRLITQGLPPSTFGFYLTSPNVGITVNPPGSQGILCLTGGIGRLNGPGQLQQSGECGLFDLMLDLTNLPTPGGFTSVMVGETHSFQCWYRDLNPGLTSNFSDAVSVRFR